MSADLRKAIAAQYPKSPEAKALQRAAMGTGELDMWEDAGLVFSLFSEKTPKGMERIRGMVRFPTAPIPPDWADTPYLSQLHQAVGPHRLSFGHQDEDGSAVYGIEIQQLHPRHVPDRNEVRDCLTGVAVGLLAMRASSSSIERAALQGPDALQHVASSVRNRVYRAEQQQKAGRDSGEIIKDVCLRANYDLPSDDRYPLQAMKRAEKVAPISPPPSVGERIPVSRPRVA